MKLRDEKGEVPANFGNFLNRWSLESMTCITLNRRLGLLKDNNRDENATQLMQVCEFIKTVNELKLFCGTTDLGQCFE